MRLSKEQLYELTGLRRRSSQVEWFRNRFGTEPPHDRQGPIVSAHAIEMLIQRKLGLMPCSTEDPRPTVRLRDKEK